MAGQPTRSLNIKFLANIRDFSTKLQNMERQMEKTSKKFKDIGGSLSKNLTLPITALGGVSVKVFADFEQSMAKVQAVSGATGEEFKKLKDSALLLGSTTKFTASEVSQLQLNLSKLGFSAQEIDKSTASVLQLAQATDEDLAQSATVAASTLRGFGLEASEMQRVVDVMADSFSSTSLDLSKFETAMANVAPVANQAGSSLENTTALLGVLTNRGVDASTAGTALRNIFLRLSKHGLTWNEAMQQILSSTEPLTTAMDLFGERGASVATIVANNADEIANLNADFIDSQGEAKRMAEIMDKTLAGSFRSLMSALEGLAIGFGEILAPTINKLAGFATSLARGFNGLDDSTKKIIVVMASLAAAIGPVLLGIGMAIKVIPILAGALAFLTGPIGLVIIGITALATAVYLIYDNWGGISQWFKELWVSMKQSLYKNIADFLKGIGVIAGAVDKLIGTNMAESVNNAEKSFRNLSDTAHHALRPAAGFWEDIGDKSKEAGEKSTEATTTMDTGIKKVSASLGTVNQKLQENIDLQNRLGGISQGTFNQVFGEGSNQMEAERMNVSEDVSMNEFLSKEGEEFKRIEDEKLKKTEETEQAIREARKRTVDLTIDGIGNLAGALNSLGKKSKGLALLEIAANTARGISSAIAAGAGLVFPANIGAIASGIAAVVSGMAQAKAALSDAPAFAKGGMVTGETLARVGDNPSGKEAIIPFERMGQFLNMANKGGSGGQLTARISGNDLLFLLDETRKNQNFNG